MSISLSGCLRCFPSLTRFGVPVFSFHNMGFLKPNYCLKQMLVAQKPFVFLTFPLTSILLQYFPAVPSPNMNKSVHSPQLSMSSFYKFLLAANLLFFFLMYFSTLLFILYFSFSEQL
jgi:hypothetical protein